MDFTPLDKTLSTSLVGRFVKGSLQGVVTLATVGFTFLQLCEWFGFKQQVKAFIMSWIH